MDFTVNIVQNKENLYFKSLRNLQILFQQSFK